MQGRLGYNADNDRYGLLSVDDWLHDGFHCGDPLEVLVDGEWVQSRMELRWTQNGGEWYLVGTPYSGKDLEFVIAKIPD